MEGERKKGEGRETGRERRDRRRRVMGKGREKNLLNISHEIIIPISYYRVFVSIAYHIYQTRV